jgi:hypothetical protein
MIIAMMFVLVAPLQMFRRVSAVLVKMEHFFIKMTALQHAPTLHMLTVCQEDAKIVQILVLIVSILLQIA